MVDIGPALLGLRYLRDFTKWVSGLRHDAEVLTRVNEALEKVGEVQDKLQELREDNLRLVEEKRELTERFRAQEDAARTDASLVYRDGEYYKQASGGSEDGPYCSRCWDTHRRLVRVHVSEFFRTCPQCHIEMHAKK